MALIWQLLALLTLIYLILLFGRIVLGLLESFSPDWRPRGFMLVVAETIYSATDPPIRALGRVIPPVRIGAVSLDVAFTVVFIVVLVLYRIFTSLS